MTIILEVPKTSYYDGHQDSEGVIHYDPVQTPHGPLGSFKAQVDAGELVIWEAPEVCLIAKQEKWETDPVGVTWYHNPLGFTTIVFRARNGIAVYKVLDDELKWSDRDDPVNCHLGILQYAKLDDGAVSE